MNNKIPKSDLSGLLPLSFIQQHIWNQNQLEANNPIQNRSVYFLLTGFLNVDALTQSLNEIVRRHEVLRSQFPLVNGKPTLKLIDKLSISLPIIDLSQYSKPKQSEQLEHIIHTESRKPFDLVNGPLIRTQLLKTRTEEHLLHITSHQIIFDEWSIDIFKREITALYAVFSAKQPNLLPELPIQYADYAHWQQQHLTEPKLQSHLAYWTAQLRGELPIMELPTDKPRSLHASVEVSTHTLLVSQRLTGDLKILSQQQGVTLFMLLLTVFQVLLYRYTKQTDMIVGTPISDRELAGTEDLIGAFLNILPIRTSVIDDLTFQELLDQVKRTVLDAFVHRSLPFDQIVKAIQSESSQIQHPIFQTSFQFSDLSKKVKKDTRLIIEETKVGWEIDSPELVLNIIESPKGLLCHFQFLTELFKPLTIQRMAGHYQTLLEGIIEDITKSVNTLPFLTEKEQHELLLNWNNIDVHYPKEHCIHQLFESQVEKTPEAIAIIFEDTHLTYRELNFKANQLAHYLQNLGIGPEVMVGICFERSIEMIVGLLAILKAGGAYIPIDPDCPNQRLQFILTDAQVSILITQQQYVEKVQFSDAKVLVLDSVQDAIDQMSSENLSSTVTPDNLAYVIYTSGSTGNPKGVLIEHQNVVRLFAATQNNYQFSPKDCWTLFHSYAFDFSVWELWGALIYGGRLVVVPYWVSRSPQEFYDLLVQHQVTVLNQTPSAFRQLIQVDQTRPSDALDLRYIIFGGEALHTQTLLPWFERHGDQSPQLINMYGITETTVHVTYHPLHHADIDETGCPIGKPLDDLQVYILDSYDQLVPIGVPGELHVAGAGLARGYLNRLKLTEERFISNPFGEGYLYKSGDLARYLSDGSLEFLGRIDYQVKIRGFRVEIGEIETTLAQYPHIKETVVVVRNDTQGNKYLVAYLGTSKVVNFDELRHFLKSKLPSFMIPSAFIILENLPLTSNGKIDRRALPIPDSNHRALEKELVAPRNLVEEKLSLIWQELLKLEQVSVFDNFFDLGGHSLTATQIINRVEQEFNLSIPLSVLFNSPTLEEFSAVIDVLCRQHTNLDASEEYESCQREEIEF